MQDALPTRFIVISENARRLDREADQHDDDAEPEKDFEEETLHAI